ncbi:unnamed protein product [Paramecium sonneborni]|uniref:Uncharacterized protein n=1 Tax=Paramecium sonneborni TaxID=65129 RepID=A0A8S1Q1E3_9CILI|nr:unnamed protein product [Paramecium sonneborni]
MVVEKKNIEIYKLLCLYGLILIIKMKTVQDLAEVGQVRQLLA